MCGSDVAQCVVCVTKREKRRRMVFDDSKARWGKKRQKCWGVEQASKRYEHRHTNDDAKRKKERERWGWGGELE